MSIEEEPMDVTRTQALIQRFIKGLRTPEAIEAIQLMPARMVMTHPYARVRELAIEGASEEVAAIMYELAPEFNGTARELRYYAESTVQ